MTKKDTDENVFTIIANLMHTVLFTKIGTLLIFLLMQVISASLIDTDTVGEHHLINPITYSTPLPRVNSDKVNTVHCRLLCLIPLTDSRYI